MLRLATLLGSRSRVDRFLRPMMPRRNFHSGASFKFVALFALFVGCGMPDVERVRRNDLTAAAEIFRGNIAAIHSRDTEAYLSYYLNSPDFVVTGPDSLRRGFVQFAEARRIDDEWPDTLMAGELTLVWIAPGVVYGAYPYTVIVSGDSGKGWSERLFVKVGGSWKIAVTSVIPASGNL